MKRSSKRPYAHARRKQQEDARNRRAYLIISGTAIMLVAILATGLAVSRPTNIDKTTGCPADNKAPQAHTVLLIDETDKLSRPEIQYARSVVMNEYLWLPVGGRLTVRNVLSNTDDAIDIVVCRLDDGSKVLGLVKNPRKVKRDFDNIAGARLQKLLIDLATAPPQKYSPLVEYISEAMDRPDFGDHVPARRLVIVSDMAQHSADFSQYALPGRAIKPNLEYFERDLSGVSVRVHYIVRRTLKMQGPRHKQFWKKYFTSMGSQDVSIGHELRLGTDQSKEIWSDTPT